MAGKIGLVGAGAVGSYYGLMLQKAGFDVHFLLRSNYDQVKQAGFQLIHHRPEFFSEEIKELNIYDKAEEIGICDWVVIASKTTAKAEIPSVIDLLVGSKTGLVSLQNGMGNVENLADFLGTKGKLLEDYALPVLIVPLQTPLKVYYPDMFNLDKLENNYLPVH